MESYADKKEKKNVSTAVLHNSIHMDMFNRFWNAQHIVYVGRKSFFI